MKELDINRKQNIQRFFRFLKLNGYYSRFIVCTHMFPSTSFTYDKWINKTEKLTETCIHIPFEWEEETNDLNEYKFWSEVNRQWINEINNKG